MGISTLLSGLQLLSLTSRLPVRHCRLMYSLSSGSSWASMDVIADTSKYNRHGPLVSVQAALLSSGEAAAATVASTPAAGSASRLGLPSAVSLQGGTHPSEAGPAEPACRHGCRQLQAASDATLAAAREAAGVLESAWMLGLFRLAVFACAIVALVVLHSVALVAWDQVGALQERPLPRMLVFPRLECLVLLAMPAGVPPLPPPACKPRARVLRQYHWHPWNTFVYMVCSLLCTAAHGICSFTSLPCTAYWRLLGCNSQLTQAGAAFACTHVTWHLCVVSGVAGSSPRMLDTPGAEGRCVWLTAGARLQRLGKLWACYLRARPRAWWRLPCSRLRCTRC